MSTGCRFFMVLLMALGALGLLGQAAGNRPLSAETSPLPAGDARRVGLASALIVEGDLHLTDTPGLAIRVLDLTPGERAQVDRLSAERHAEADRLLMELGDSYATKVQSVLPPQQAALYQAVLAVLKTLRDETETARQEFLRTVGPEAEEHVAGRLSPGALEAEDLLSLSEEQQAAVEQLREARQRALFEALRQRMDRTQASDLETWRTRRRQFRDAQQKAQADFGAARDALLTAEQRERLASAAAAIETCDRRLYDARQKATDRLMALLGPPAQEP